MNTTPLTVNNNSLSLARINLNDGLSVLANQITKSLSHNVLEQEDFIMSLPKSADLDSALMLNCSLAVSLSFSFNSRDQSAPFRVFTRNLNTVKSIYDAFNQSWVDWKKERQQGCLLVDGYMRQNNIAQIKDPSQIVKNYLVDPIVPIHATIQLPSLLKLTNKYGIVVSDYYTIPIVFCIICLFDPSYHGCPLHLFSAQDGVQHAKSVSHEKQLEYHCVLLNLKYPTYDSEIEDEYIDESTGNDESSHNMNSDEEINDKSNSKSIN